MPAVNLVMDHKDGISQMGIVLLSWFDFGCEIGEHNPVAKGTAISVSVKNRAMPHGAN